MIPSGTTLRFYCWYGASGVAKTGLSPVPTVSILGPAGATLVNAQNASEEGLGFYFYSYTTVADIYGGIHAVFATADATVDQKQLPGLLDDGYTLTAAKVGYIDASINSRSSHSAADVWAVNIRTLSTAGVQAIWDALTSALTTAGSIGKYIIDKLGLLSSDAVQVVGAANDSTVTVYQGTDYNNSDGRRLEWTVTGAPALTGGLVSVVVDNGTGPAANATFTGSVLSATSVGLELTAADTTTLTAGPRDFRIFWANSTSAGARSIVLVEGTWTTKPAY
jgi:hypothetical protein